MCSIALIYSRSFGFTCFVLFILGFLVSGNFSVCYVYNMEFFTPEWQSVMGSLDNIFQSILFGCIPLFFLYGSKNYVNLLVIGMIANLVAISGFVLFLEESPLYLFNTNQIEKAKLIQDRIIKIN